MIHVPQFSTGVGSAEVLRRVVEEHGSENVIALTADTRVEDYDNWRFAREVIDRWTPRTWEVIADGRTPMEVGRDERCVPNDRMAVCSKILKRKLLRAWLEENCDPADTVVYIGYDWTEEHRLEDARPHWEPWTIDAPLCRPPKLHKFQLLARFRDAGIEPPRLYPAGFSHANCGGGCVRGGQTEWRRLLFWNRERYLTWEAEEEKTRVHLKKDVAILRHRSGPLEDQPLTLRSFREGLERDASLFDSSDVGACDCMSASA